MAGRINPTVAATDELAAHFRQINQRLASLERASSSGSGGGGGGSSDVMWVGPSAPADSTIELWYDTDEAAASIPTQADADLRYVNVTGDTMTGALNADLLLNVAQRGDANAATRKDWVEAQRDSRVAKVGDAMTGPLSIRGDNETLTLKRATAGGWNYVSYWNEAGSRRGYCGLGGDAFYVAAEYGELILLSSSQVRTSGMVLMGAKSTSTWWASPGMEIWTNGQAFFASESASPQVHIAHYGASDANGIHFVGFYRYTTGIGAITQQGSGNTYYGTTSHGPWKGNVTDLDNNEAIDRVERWRPVSFQWKFDAEGNQSEDGEPSGMVERGFIAQEMNEVSPEAVVPGHGTEAEHRDWVRRMKAATEAGEPFEEPDPFQSWMGDWAKLVPDLAAAVQGLIRQVRAQAAEIAELRAELRGAT